MHRVAEISSVYLHNDDQLTNKQNNNCFSNEVQMFSSYVWEVFPYVCVLDIAYVHIVYSVVTRSEVKYINVYCKMLCNTIQPIFIKLNVECVLYIYYKFEIYTCGGVFDCVIFFWWRWSIVHYYIWILICTCM